MASDVQLKKKIKLALENAPKSIGWGEPRKVYIRTGEDRKLGLNIRTFQENSCSKTYTVVTRVKPDCSFMNAQRACLYDRVTSINNIDILEFKEQQVFDLLFELKEKIFTPILFTLCKIERLSDILLNRSFSSNSGSSQESYIESQWQQADSRRNNRACDMCSWTRDFVGEDINHTQSLPIESMGSRRPKVQDKYIMEYPHRIRWSQTKTFCLRRGSKGTFGFRYVTRLVKTGDGSSEMFTLIKSVQPEGPCNGLLKSGDWIRSINGVALQNTHEVSEIIKSMEKSDSLKVVIQRPEGYSSTPSSPNESHEFIQVSVDPPTSNIAHCPHELRPYDSLPIPGSFSLDLKDVSKKKTLDRSPDSLKNEPLSNTANLPRSAKIKESRPLITPSKFPFVCDSPYLVPEHGNKNEIISMTELDLSLSESEQALMGDATQDFIKTVKLPKIRIFICGQEAVTFSKFILRNHASHISGSHFGFSYLRCSVEIGKDGVPQFNQWSPELYSSVLNHPKVKQQLSEGHSMGKHLNENVHNEASDQSYGHSAVVNAEIFIVPDDRFFNHCCHFLFTATSIFLLTFNGTKLLKSPPTEIMRIQNLIHTIRCCVGDDAPILTYGLVSESTQTSHTLAEVEILFYTSYGDQLKKFEVNSPEMLDSSFSDFSQASWIPKVEKVLWMTIMETIQIQPILLASLSVIIQLEEQVKSNHRVVNEEIFEKIVRTTIPNCQQDLQHMILLELRTCGQIISTKSGPFNSTVFADSMLLLDPEALLQPMKRLIHLDFSSLDNQEQVKQNWLDLQYSATIDCSDFINYTMDDDKESQLILSFLECFGILNRKKNKYCIPYFLQEPNYLEEPQYDRDDILINIMFHARISSLTFFQLIWYVENQGERCTEMSVQDSRICHLRYDDVNFSFIHEKQLDRIVVQVKGDKKPVKPVIYHSWVEQICREAFSSDTSFTVKLVSAKVLSQNLTVTDILPTGVVAETSQSKCTVSEENNIQYGNEHLQSKSGTGNMKAKTEREDKGAKSVSNSGAKAEGKENKGVKNKPRRTSMCVNELPYSVLQSVCQLLDLPQDGRDWRAVAEHLDLNIDVQKIKLYAQVKDPSQTLLLDWSCSRLGTVDQLMTILKYPEIDRRDVIKCITDFLDH
ncbi:hypothetical protein ScPMuIL_007526 [Solemya velum]